MNLFELLSHDERIIVLSLEEDQILVTWNQSLTLQMWQDRQYARAKHSSYWEELNVRTLESEPKNYAAARAKALEWMAMFSNHSSQVYQFTLE